MSIRSTDSLNTQKTYIPIFFRQLKSQVGYYNDNFNYSTIIGFLHLDLMIKKSNSTTQNQIYYLRQKSVWFIPESIMHSVISSLCGNGLLRTLWKCTRQIVYVLNEGHRSSGANIPYPYCRNLSAR